MRTPLSSPSSPTPPALFPPSTLAHLRPDSKFGLLRRWMSFEPCPRSIHSFRDEFTSDNRINPSLDADFSILDHCHWHPFWPNWWSRRRIWATSSLLPPLAPPPSCRAKEKLCCHSHPSSPQVTLTLLWKHNVYHSQSNWLTIDSNRVCYFVLFPGCWEPWSNLMGLGCKPSLFPRRFNYFCRAFSKFLLAKS